MWTAALLILKALPWRLIAVGVAIAAVVWWVNDYAEDRYAAGQSEVQNRWDAREAGRIVLARAAQDDLEHERAEHQAAVDRLAAQNAQARAEAAADRDRLVADGNRLRDQIRAITGAHRPQAAAAPVAAGRSDDPTETFGELLGSCTSMAERSAGEAEELAERLRGLQSFQTLNP